MGNLDNSYVLSLSEYLPKIIDHCHSFKHWTKFIGSKNYNHSQNTKGMSSLALVVGLDSRTKLAHGNAPFLSLFDYHQLPKRFVFQLWPEFNLPFSA